MSKEWFYEGQLRRYRQAGPRLEPDDNGNWVPYEDVKRLLFFYETSQKSIDALTKVAYPSICWDCDVELQITDGGACLDCGAPLGLEAAVKILKERLSRLQRGE